MSFLFYYFHLKRVMAKLQHMCLRECDHPLQIKTTTNKLYHKHKKKAENESIENSGHWESNPVCALPKGVYYRYTMARFIFC